MVRVGAAVQQLSGARPTSKSLLKNVGPRLRGSRTTMTACDKMTAGPVAHL